MDRLQTEIARKEEQTKKNAFKFKSTPEAKLYKMLFKFGRKLANESKKLIYYIMQKKLRLTDMQDDLCKLGSSCTFLCENKGKPYNINDTSHQVLRSFLHMNDRSLQAIIWSYLQLYYGLCEEKDAFTVLLCAIEYEVFHCYRKSEAWDVMTLHELLLENNGNLLLQRDYDSEAEANILLVGIHNGLVEMKEKVVLIEWIGDWKNVIKLWKYDKGPLYGLVTPQRDNKDTMYVSEYTVKSYSSAVYSPRIKFFFRM